MNFDGLGKKVRPGTFGRRKVVKRELPKSPSVKKHECCSDPVSADPMFPFPSADADHALEGDASFYYSLLCLIISLLSLFDVCLCCVYLLC